MDRDPADLSRIDRDPADLARIRMDVENLGLSEPGAGQVT